jgi:hypothetical protein
MLGQMVPLEQERYIKGTIFGAKSRDHERQQEPQRGEVAALRLRDELLKPVASS